LPPGSAQRSAIGFPIGSVIITISRCNAYGPLRNHPELLDKGRAFFKRWGIWAIVLARFSGPSRASVPIVAGIAEMPVLKFQSANWTSAFLWAFVLFSPGWGASGC
jgi:membrane protein DedA with SNARE-associated domain